MCGQPVSWWPSPTPQECDSVTARPVLIMFYILTRPSPHYSLKCKSSQQPYMEDEHGLNRWLHLHTCHLSPLSYISIIFWLGIYTAHTRHRQSSAHSTLRKADWGYYMCYMWQQTTDTVVFRCFISYKIHTWLLQSLFS